MNPWLNIFTHEIKKIVSDKKVFASIFILPIVTVLLMLMVSSAEINNSKDVYEIFVLNNAMEASTVELDEKNTIEIVPIKDTTYDDALKNNDISKESAVLKFNDDGSAIVYYNSSNDISKTLSNYCKQTLEDSYYVSYVSANQMETYETEIVDYNDSQFNRMIAVFLPYMLILLLFTNVSNYTCDTIAGEKERGVFSKTILAPISTSSIVIGKMLSSTMFGLFSSLVYVIILGLGSYGFDKLLDVDILGVDIAQFSFGDIFWFFLYAILLCLLISALAVLCSLYAKNAKEARSLMIPFMGLSILLSLASMTRVGTEPPHHYLIPIYNLCIIIQDILLGKTEIINMVIVGGVLLLLTVVIFGITIKLFEKESIRY